MNCYLTKNYAKKGEEKTLQVGQNVDFGVHMTYSGMTGKDTFSIAHFYSYLNYSVNQKKITIGGHVYEVVEITTESIRLKYMGKEK